MLQARNKKERPTLLKRVLSSLCNLLQEKEKDKPGEYDHKMIQNYKTKQK